MRACLLNKKFLYSITFLNQLSLSITFPVLTLVFYDPSSWLIDGDTLPEWRSFYYGLAIASTHIGGLFFIPLISLLSDYFGRKPLLILGAIGLMIVAISESIAILVGTLWLFIAGRVIGGLSAQILPLAQATISDMSTSHNKFIHMGTLQFMISAAACIGPILGGFFAKNIFFSSLNYATPFIIAIFTSVLCFFITQYYFHETLLHSQRKKKKFDWPAYKKLLTQKNIIAISIQLFFLQFGWRIYYQFILPVLKVNFGFSAPSLGLFSGMIALWLALATPLLMHRFSNNYSLPQIIQRSTFMMLIGLMMTVIAVSLQYSLLTLILIWIAAIPLAMGDVIAYSAITTQYSDAVGNKEQGAIMSICHVIVSIIWVGSGFLGGLLSGVNLLLPLLVAPLGIIILIVAKFYYSPKIVVTPVKPNRE